MQTTVQSITSVGPDTIAVDLQTPPEFTAAPGQFVKLQFEIGGETMGRFYTISSPSTTDTFELTIGFDPEAGGAVTERLQSLNEDDVISFEGPFGQSTYEGEKRVLVLAGGPGIGPAVAIADVALAAGADVTLVYQATAPVHQQRLDALEVEGATVWVGDASLADGVAAVDADATDAQVFVFGFADLVAEATAISGIDATTAKIENFG
jgi:cytochrome-b5 reductase